MQSYNFTFTVDVVLGVSGSQSGSTKEPSASCKAQVLQFFYVGMAWTTIIETKLSVSSKCHPSQRHLAVQVRMRGKKMDLERDRDSEKQVT